MNKMIENQFPKGWDENKVRKVITYYENQTEDETVLASQTLIQVPTELVSAILDILELIPNPVSKTHF
jgi:hypothetical protein